MYQSNRILTLVFIFSLFSAFGQVKFNAPYSSEGLGEINNTGLTFQRGMGGLGVASSNVQFINLTNPALLTRTGYTNMEFGVQANTRYLKEGSNSQTNTDVTLSNVAFAFPITRIWTTAFGITPYSTVNYQTQKQVLLQDGATIATQKNIGSGGISKFYFSNGVQVYKDSVRKIQTYLGLEMGYLFGLVDKRNEIHLSKDGVNENTYTQQSTKTRYSDFVFRPALAVRKEISVATQKERKTVKYERNRPYYDKDTLPVVDYPTAKRVIIKNGEITTEPSTETNQTNFKLYLKEEIQNNKGQITQIYERISEKDYFTAKRIQILEDTLINTEKLFKKDSLNQGSGIFANFGLVYEHSSQLKASQLFAIERYTNGDLSLSVDTITNTTQSVTLPSQIQIGFCLDKPLPKGHNERGELKERVWSIGTDLSFTQWSQYKDVYGNQNLNNTYKITLGGEYVPQILGTKTLKRTIYRAGLYYGTLPYQYSVKTQDLGISFGMSVPVGPFTAKKLPRYVNLAINYGQRGDFNNKLIKEHYFATSLSITVNNKWFQRYKVGL